MSKAAVLQRVLDDARRNERHKNLSEARYWCDQYKQIASEAVKALTQPHQEHVAWTPDRSGKYLTVVYRDVVPGDEVGALHDHPKCVAMSWSNALHDVDYLRNRLPPHRKPLTGAEIHKWWASENGLEDCYMAKFDDFVQVVRAIEAAHGIKTGD